MHSSAASQTPIEGLPLVFVIPSYRLQSANHRAVQRTKSGPQRPPMTDAIGPDAVKALFQEQHG